MKRRRKVAAVAPKRGYPFALLFGMLQLIGGRRHGRAEIRRGPRKLS